MEVEIIEEKENPLLKRREIRFKTSYDGPTPSRKDVRAELVSKLGIDGELTVLDRFESEYGRRTASGYVKVYRDREALKVEPEYKLEKNFKKEESKSDAGEAQEAKKGSEKPEAAAEPGKEDEKPADSGEDAGNKKESQEESEEGK